MTYELVVDNGKQTFALATITGLKELDQFAMAEGGPLLKKFAETNQINDVPALRLEILDTLKNKNMPQPVRSTLSYMVTKSLKSGDTAYVTDGFE